MQKIGIVVQGGYIKDYTKNIILNYKKELPEAYICLSTWEDDYEQFKDEIESLKTLELFSLKINKKPKLSGHWNINYQIVSSYNGIKTLKDFEITHVFKVRTDFEWDLPSFITKYEKLENRDKIIGLEPGQDMIEFPFTTMDYIFFGRIEMIEKLFDIPLSNYNDERTILKPYYNTNGLPNSIIPSVYYHIRDVNKDLYFESNWAEPYIIKHFFKNMGLFLPKSSLEYRFFSIILMVEYFELLNMDDIGENSYKNIKNHILITKGNFKLYKELVKRKKFVQLLIKTIKIDLKYKLFVSAQYKLLLISRIFKYNRRDF